MIHRDYHCCEEDIIATIAVSLGRSFELMYCNAWGLEYNRDAGESIGQKLFEGKNDYFKNIELYHGIVFRDEGTFTKKDVYDILTRSKYDFPIILYIDNFHCPWYHTNITINRPHPILITKVDGDRWYCMDPYLSIENAILTHDCIPEWGAKIYAINIQDVQIELSIFESFIEECSRRISLGEAATMLLYNDMSELDGLDNEIVLQHGHIVSDLLDRLTYLSRRRRQYGEFVIFLSILRKTKVTSLTESFFCLSNSWEIICKKLMKIYCMKSWNNDKSDFLDLLSKTLYHEVLLANQILDKGFKGYEYRY